MSWEWSQRATFTYYVLVAVLELILNKKSFFLPRLMNGILQANYSFRPVDPKIE